MTYEIVRTGLSESCFQEFIRYLDVSACTVRSYKSGLKRFAEYMRVHGVNSPTAETVINFKNYLVNNGKKSATVALYLSALRRFFSWSEKSGIYPNIATGIKAPKNSKGHKRDCFSAQQLKDILSNIDNKRDYAVFALMATCGLRTIEVSRAKVEDLRNVGGVSVLYVQGKGKNDKSDFVKIPAKVEQAIRDYLKTREKIEQSEALFTSISNRNKGQALTTHTISAICKTAMLTAGFDSARLTAHSLRHSAVTIALMNGESLHEVQAFARHTDINTTLIYSHAVNRMKSNIENSIAKEIF